MNSTVERLENESNIAEVKEQAMVLLDLTGNKVVEAEGNKGYQTEEYIGPGLSG